MDPETGRMRVRMVDVDSDRYRIAYAYMLRLKRSDFEDRGQLAKLAAAAHTTPEGFHALFGHLADRDVPSIAPVT
jgi:6-phosphofructokinase 1